MATKNEIRANVKLSKAFNKLVDSAKVEAKGIFAVHRTALKMLTNESLASSGLTYSELESMGIIQVNGKNYVKNEVLKNIDKEIKPFELFGLFTLDKYLKTVNTTDFYSVFKPYVKALLTFINSDEITRLQIIERGKALNELKSKFVGGEVSGLEFARELFSYFPSFHEGLKKDSCPSNVAKFLYENDVQTYETLKIWKLHNFEQLTLINEVRKTYGLKGETQLQSLLSDGYSFENAYKVVTGEVVTLIYTEKTVKKVATAEGVTAQ
jgi:hypothetical protein